MFAKSIDEDLRWREKELAILKLQLLRDKSDVDRFRSSYRCMAAMAYAYYEGFTKRVAAEVLLLISAGSVKPSDCVSQIQRVLFSPLARKFVGQKSNEELLQLLGQALAQDLIEYPDESIYYDISNLNPTKLQWVVESIGLSFSPYTGYKKYVGKLVDLRHRCAHGEKLSFDATKTATDLADDLLATVSEVTDLMNLIGLEAIDLVDKSAYLAVPAIVGAAPTPPAVQHTPVAATPTV